MATVLNVSSIGCNGCKYSRQFDRTSIRSSRAGPDRQWAQMRPMRRCALGSNGAYCASGSDRDANVSENCNYRVYCATLIETNRRSWTANRRHIRSGHVVRCGAPADSVAVFLRILVSMRQRFTRTSSVGMFEAMGARNSLGHQTKGRVIVLFVTRNQLVGYH